MPRAASVPCIVLYIKIQAPLLSTPLWMSPLCPAALASTLTLPFVGSALFRKLYCQAGTKTGTTVQELWKHNCSPQRISTLTEMSVKITCMLLWPQPSDDGVAALHNSFYGYGPTRTDLPPSALDTLWDFIYFQLPNCLLISSLHAIPTRVHAAWNYTLQWGSRSPLSSEGLHQTCHQL